MTDPFQTYKRCFGTARRSLGYTRQRPNAWLAVAAIASYTSVVITATSAAAQQTDGPSVDTKEEQTPEPEKGEASTIDEEKATESPPDNVEDQSPSEETEEPDRRKSIIFNVLKESDPAILNLILEALQAQLSDVDVQLVFNGGVIESSELRNLIEKGKSMAEPHDAVGVFWLDANHGENWLLYLVDPAGERVLVRRAGAGLESLTATVEAVAVITRSSSKALLDGRIIGLGSSEKIDNGVDSWTELQFRTKSEQELRNEVEESERTEAIKRAVSVDRKDSDKEIGADESKRKPLRLAIAYRGTTFAQQEPWQSGIGIWGGWITDIGIYVGLGYLWTPDANVTTNLTYYNTLIEFRIERSPFELFSGYQYRTGLFALEGELGIIFDRISRRSQPVSSSEKRFKETTDSSDIAIGLLSHGRVEYFLERHLALFAGLGLEIFLRNFDYVAELEKREMLLNPSPVRFDLEVGLAFHL
jgi:hypothetical protein